jgi:hypothetical protein
MIALFVVLAALVGCTSVATVDGSPAPVFQDGEGGLGLEGILEIPFDLLDGVLGGLSLGGGEGGEGGDMFSGLLDLPMQLIDMVMELVQSVLGGLNLGGSAG